MPITKERPHIIDLLNIAVAEQRKLQDTKSEILLRPASIWWARDASLSGGGLSSQAYVGFILLSRMCEKISSSLVMKVIRGAGWIVLFTVLIYAAPLHDLNYNTYPTPGVQVSASYYKLSIVLNVWFIVDSLLKILGFLIRIKVEKAFNREVTTEQVINDLGIIDITVSIIGLSYGLSEVGLWFLVAQLFIKTQAVLDIFPHIGILMSGIRNGFKSVIYTILLLFLLILTYGVLGHRLYATNDPFHYGTLALSALSFFRLSTFENWGTNFYVNFGGCDSYPSVYSALPPAVSMTAPNTIHTDYGNFLGPRCTQPRAQKTASVIIFCSYTIFSGYVIVSMCLAAVAIGINERLEELRSLDLFGSSNEGGDGDSLGASTPSNSNGQTSAKKRKQVFDGKAAKLTGGNVAAKKIKTNLTKIWDAGRKGVKHKFFQDTGGGAGGARRQRLTLSNLTVSRLGTEAKFAVKSLWYQLAVCATILAAALLQFYNDTLDMDTTDTSIVHAFLQALFLLDSCMRLLSHHDSPVAFFLDGWNCFDLALTVLLFLPTSLPNTPSLQVLECLRVFRMARVLQIGAAYAMDLHVILSAIYHSFICLIYVLAILILFLAYFGFMGILLFKEANPFYFGSFGDSMRTLLQVMTLDNWNDLMLASMLGCKYYPYDSTFASACSFSGRGVGWLAPAFFVVFIIITSYVLSSLLVGVIITSMELLREGIMEEQAIWRRVESVRKRYNASQASIDLLLELFEDADNIKKNGVLTYEDLEPMICQMGIDEAEVFTFYVRVDNDKNGQLDFSEFCELILLIGTNYNEKRDADEKEKREAKMHAGKKMTIPKDVADKKEVAADPPSTSSRRFLSDMFSGNSMRRSVSIRSNKEAPHNTSSTATAALSSTSASAATALTIEDFDDHPLPVIEAKDDTLPGGAVVPKPKAATPDAPRTLSFAFFSRITPVYLSTTAEEDTDHDGYYHHGL